MKDNADDIKKRVKQLEDMFLRRHVGMIAKMAKADGQVDAWDTICKIRRDVMIFCPSVVD